MIALDTNVLVRFLAEPNTAQGALANKFIIEQLTPDNPGYVSSLVLAETIWVLEDIYEVSREDVRIHLMHLLNASELFLEHADAVSMALTLPHPDLADCILHEIGQAAGCSLTATFDKRFARLDKVELVS